jgi:hypothetical protein
VFKRWLKLILVLMIGLPLHDALIPTGNIVIMERPVHMPWPVSQLRHRFIVIDHKYVLTGGPDGDWWNCNNMAYIGVYSPSKDAVILGYLSKRVTLQDLQTITGEWNKHLKRYTFRNDCNDFAKWAASKLGG